METIELIESRKGKDCYRLIVNMTDGNSVGVVLTLKELNNFYYKIKDVLDKKKSDTFRIDINN